MENQDYTLLVVDDTEENRDMLSRRLTRRGFNVLSAESGERALEIVRDEAVDLVLLDIMMPGMDGVEVLKALRQDHSQARLPVIMQTAKSDSEDMVEALDAGANDYVTKPIDFPVVLARVQSQLRGKAQASQGAPQVPSKPAEPTQAELGPGVVIDGKYRLGDRIGEGTFGAVYRGRHIELDVDVAVKVLLKNVTASSEAVRRFRQEGVSAYRVRHPNAVTVSDFGVTEGDVAYLVMELLEGISLADEIDAETVLSPHRTNEILQPICDVLAEAHEAGIVHRDIKPENIFLHRTARGETVKVLDFGISKLVGDNIVRENLTAEGFVLGTPAYMAPERLVNEPYDGRSDVYSLGIMLFFMLSGRLPFTAESGDPMALLMMHLNEPFPSLCEANPALPKKLGKLVAQAAEKTPDKRPDAATLGREFAAAVAEIPRTAPSGKTATKRAPTEIDPSAPTIATQMPAAVSGPGSKAVERPGVLGRFFRKLRKGQGSGGRWGT